MNALAFDVEDLALDELSVTTVRDGVALPDTGASSSSCISWMSSSSCCCCTEPQ
ncbi:thiazolylpeptide-type bacteriocin [Nonomuraea sp. ATR24]|uniref:thiazolylpeptide-type bacteriocin n=1 Tax=Nonomuraea TaxID=83681 RepID=UPI001C5F4F46|nr:thiazolylpeptide-type bacteriocin [Nonomuraea ceibae]